MERQLIAESGSGRSRPASMLRRLIAASIVSAGFVFTASASGADTLYWSNSSGGTDGTIGYANLSGGGSGVLNTTGASFGDPLELAIDSATGRIYWTNAAGNSISYANLSGGGGGTLTITGQTPASPSGLAIDPATGTLYWANGGTPGSINYVSVNGGVGTTLNTSPVDTAGPDGMAIDTANSTLYWANNGGGTNGSEILYASLSGGGGGVLNTTGATTVSPSSVAVDPTSGQIFWTNNGGGGVDFANLSGGSGGSLDASGCTALDDPWGLAIDLASGRIYLADTNTDQIDSANVNDTGSCSELSAGTLSNARFPTILQGPAGAGAPSISGGSVTGSTLTCSQGSWAADIVAALDFLAPQSFAYSWSENGMMIGGATSSTLTATTAGSYICQVTATNEAGSTSQASAAFTVVVPVPVISGLSLSPTHFAAASHGVTIAKKKKHKPPIGTTISYSDSQAATTSFSVLKRLEGYEKAGTCVATKPKGHKKPKRCTFYKAIGSFAHMDTAGQNQFRFTGYLLGHKLAADAYRLEAVPTYEGQAGASLTTSFTIVK